MVIKLKKPILKKAEKQTEAKVSENLKIFDIPVGQIHLSEDNPQEQDEKTFDLLVESIREDGLNEPVIIVPRLAGGFTMVSGEHRYKAACKLGYKTVPSVIQKWDDTKRQIELVKRNNLRGKLNPDKMYHLVTALRKKGIEDSILRVKMGYSKQEQFDKILRQVQTALPAKEKKQLQDAKEEIKSIDDLSSVLNTIFKNNGSKVEEGFLVFSFGGKSHYYVQIDAETDKAMVALTKQLEEQGSNVKDFFKEMLKSYSPVVEKKNGVKKTK